MQNAAPAQPQDSQKAERKFEPAKYGLTLLVVLASYLLTLALGTLLIFAIASNTQQLLNFLILVTVFYAVIAVGITTFYRPAYVPKFPVKPISVSMVVMGAGLMFLLVWIALRQPDEASQLRVVLIALIVSVLGSMIGSGAMAWAAKHPRTTDTDLWAMIIAVVGAVVSAIAVPALLHIEDPVTGMKLSILLVILGFVLFFALTVLHTINLPDVKSTAVPDGHAGVVSVKGRITRVAFDKSVDVKKGEIVELMDLRLRETTLIADNCMTADHVPTDIRATIEWKLMDTEDDVRAFKTKSTNPEGAIRTLAYYAIVNELGQRASLYIAGREDQIAAGVKRRLSGEAKQYGVQVKEIAVTHALLKYPTPAESMSPLTEVSRLNVMDPAVRHASRTTVRHAESLTNAEATALAGKEGREKDDKDEGAGKSH